MIAVLLAENKDNKDPVNNFDTVSANVIVILITWYIN